MIWSLLYWVLLSIALVVLLRGLLWDRAGFRGRPMRRCRKCWYDLTGADGDVSREPVVCPECGKGHKSKRSMRKTRRGKKWIVAAVICMLGGYTAGAWPRISRYNYANGWFGAVPTPVLIAVVPLMPDEAGTLPDRNGGGGGKRPFWERVANQVKSRIYTPEHCTRFDRWLFHRVSRLDRPDQLTERSAIRGDVYLYVYQALARQDRMGFEEARWARSVHHLEIAHAPFIQHEWFAYAHVRIRRLVSDHQWRVQIDRSLYKPVRRGDWQSWDGFYDLRPVGIDNLDWWDFNQRIYSQLITYSGISIPPQTTLTHEVAGRIYEGDEHIDLWWPVVEFREDLSFGLTRAVKTVPVHGGTGWYERVESIKGYELIDEPEPYTEWLAKHLDVEIDHSDRYAWFHDRGSMMPDRFRFYLPSDKGNRNPDLPAFTFGGLISVVLELVPGGRYDGPMPVKRIVPFHGEPAWWALRDDLDDDGNRVFTNNGHRVMLNQAERYSSPNVLVNDHLVSAYIEIRFGMEVLGDDGYRAIADLDAERFVARTVRIPLDSSNARRLAAPIKARSQSIDIGYKDLYEEGEIRALMEQYEAEGYSYRRRGSGGSGWTGTP